jgi:hypothetical protein
LENSIVTWSPSLLHPECDTIRIRFEEYSSTIAIRTEYQNGSLAVFMGSCPPKLVPAVWMDRCRCQANGESHLRTKVHLRFRNFRWC